VRALLSLPWNRTEENTRGRFWLHFSEEADELRKEFLAIMEPRLGPGGDLGHLQKWTSKLWGRTLRLAGLLHIMDRSESKAPWEEVVDRDAMRRAIRMVYYFIPHTVRAFSLMRCTPEEALTGPIVAWIKHRRVETFSRRELHFAVKGRFKLVEELDKPLAVLATHGYIRKLPPAMTRQ
jgi:hypothetical protein